MFIHFLNTLWDGLLCLNWLLSIYIYICFRGQRYEIFKISKTSSVFTEQGRPKIGVAKMQSTRTVLKVFGPMFLVSILKNLISKAPWPVIAPHTSFKKNCWELKTYIKMNWKLLTLRWQAVLFRFKNYLRKQIIVKHFLGECNFRCALITAVLVFYSFSFMNCVCN